MFLCSALRDRRFPAIQRKEVTSLQCTVSLLHSFESAVDWQDWDIGRHGLIIVFTDPYTAARRTATFLPEVAAHENWSKQYTIDALIRKAGFSGSVSSALRLSLTVTRYQSTAYTMSHNEYIIQTTAPISDAEGQLAASRVPIPVQA